MRPYAFPAAILALVLTPFLVIGISILAVLYLRVKKQISLYQDGRVIDAEVISVVPKSWLGKKIMVHYQYQTTNGQRILGESITNDYTILTSKKQGDRIKIFVSPKDEKKSCLIPRLEEIRNNWKI